MVSPRTRGEAVRMAIGSIYIQKTATHKLDRVETFVDPRVCDCDEHPGFITGEPRVPLVNPTQ